VRGCSVFRGLKSRSWAGCVGNERLVEWWRPTGQGTAYAGLAGGSGGRRGGDGWIVLGGFAILTGNQILSGIGQIADTSHGNFL